MPRTGSSHLNKLLKSIPELNAKSELFHAKRQVVLSPRELAMLKQRSGMDVDDKPAFAAWRRAHPLATLEAIRDGAWRKRIVAFKVFPGHVEHGLLETELIPRDDTAFAILTRRPIESYISGRKAQNAGTFSKQDTTDIKPELSSEDFGAWARKMRRWYRWCEETLEAKGKPFARISYERHLDRESGADAVRDLIALLRPLGVDRLSEPSEVTEGQRQDRERRYQDRVANWAAFEAEVRADPRLAKLLDWAQRPS
ncbi:MAG: hypothetical protein JOZ72_19030 [Alphaproteobacteria bacterium]|nr:hypothetical protein [Alphaproteobacteria bacterium]